MKRLLIVRVMDALVGYRVLVLVGSGMVRRGHVVMHSLIIVVLVVVVWVRGADLLGVGMIITSLGDDVVLPWGSHGEVKRLVLFVLIVIGVVLVSMDVLRGHVVVAGS